MFVPHIVGLVGFGCADVSGKTPPRPRSPSQTLMFSPSIRSTWGSTHLTSVTSVSYCHCEGGAVSPFWQEGKLGAERLGYVGAAS